MLLVKMEVSILLHIILDTYFFQERCSILLYDSGSTFTYSGNHQIISISIDADYKPISKVIDDIIFNFEYGCKGIVIDVLNPVKIFEYIEEKIERSVVRYNTRKYLIIIRNNIDKLDELFLDSTSLRFVTNLLFLKKIHHKEAQLWSHSFVGKRDEIRFELVDTWFFENSSLLNRRNPFTYKLQNQHGRTLKLSCFTYAPYTYCDQYHQLDEYYGTELNSAIIFAEIHNFTPKLVYNEKNDEFWGELYPNWTGTGLMGNVLRGEADIGFTAFYLWDFVYKYLDMSQTFVRTGVSCLVPKPKILDGWTIPILSYQLTLWIAVISNFVLDAILLFLVQICLQRKFKITTGSKNGTCDILIDSLWIMMKISLDQSVLGKKLIIIERFILAILFSVYLVLNASFFSGLASIMTMPRYEDTIDTAVSLANSDLNILGIYDSWVTSIQYNEEERYKKIVERFRTIPVHEISKHLEEDGNAFFMERLQYSDYGANDFIKGEVIRNYHLMREDIFFELTSFYLRKSSILAPSFNIFILRVKESGLPSYWQKKAIYKLMDSGIQKLASMMDNSKLTQEAVVKLRFSHVEGSFFLLFIGYVLSAITFLLERLIHYKFGDTCC